MQVVQNENSPIPSDNIPVSTTPIKPIAQPTEETPVQAPTEQSNPVEPIAEGQEPVQEEDDDSSDDSDLLVSDDEDGAADEEENPLDAFGEQSVEVPGPLSVEQEAAEAMQLAISLGLSSTDEALNRIGVGNERLKNTVTNANNLLNTDTEAVQFYDNLSQKIATLTDGINTGIRKLISDSFPQQTIDQGAVDVFRNQLESFLRSVLHYSVVFAEYKSRKDVDVSHVLAALAHLGRPLYWHTQITPSSENCTTTLTGDSSVNESLNESAMEEDDDDDFVPEEEEDDEMNWQQQQTEPEEEEPTNFYITAEVFKDATEVILGSSFEGSLSGESYEAVHTACENYLGSVLEATSKACQYVGKTTPTAQEVKFALDMIHTVRH